ncbi:MAG: hypothetical protein HRU38_15025 [Saccharospirillaceae bacterium]|nr:hypothetical protein [Pseudomonadales bacterium]NRB79954.1 hypothetical protein [Saccharospirillaceae bacterium]
MTKNTDKQQKIKQLKRIMLIQKFMYCIVTFNIFTALAQLAGLRLIASGPFLLQIIFVITGILFININYRKIFELENLIKKNE